MAKRSIKKQGLTLPEDIGYSQSGEYPPAKGPDYAEDQYDSRPRMEQVIYDNAPSTDQSGMRAHPALRYPMDVSGNVEGDY